METFLLALHVLVCLFLIFIVLIQGGKGAQMGAAFGGGSSQTLFGGRGASTFLSKLTTAMAVVFMLTSLTLAVVAGRGDDGSDINLDAPVRSELPFGTELPPSTVTQPIAPSESEGGLAVPPAVIPDATPEKGQAK